MLLAGDASYDPKNYTGQGYNDLVPTKLLDTALLETASDDWLADFEWRWGGGSGDWTLAGANSGGNESGGWPRSSTTKT